jgi:hypothetical protein
MASTYIYLQSWFLFPLVSHYYMFLLVYIFICVQVVTNSGIWLLVRSDPTLEFIKFSNAFSDIDV